MPMISGALCPGTVSVSDRVPKRSTGAVRCERKVMYPFVSLYRPAPVKGDFMWWSWIQSGWLFLLIPLVMMVVCILMCIFVCGVRSCGCGACCGGMQHTRDHSPK